MKTKMLTLRVSTDDVARLDRFAAASRRSRSSVIRMLLQTAKLRVKDIESAEVAA